MNSFNFVKNVIENNGIFAKNLYFIARYSAEYSVSADTNFSCIGRSLLFIF